MWQSGVAQRIKTSDLKRFLKQQIREIGERLEVEEKEVHDLNDREEELDRQTAYNNRMRGEFQQEVSQSTFSFFFHFCIFVLLSVLKKALIHKST